MRNAQGVMLISDPAAGLQEADTFTCFHCQYVTQVKPMSDPAAAGGFCRVCMKLICKNCVGKSCTPFEKKIQAMEEKYYRRRQLERMAGL